MDPHCAHWGATQLRHEFVPHETDIMMLDLRESMDLLGLSLPQEARASDIALLEYIQRGFSRETLERLSAALAPEAPSFKYRIVPKSSLARRSSPQRRLSASQSLKVARLASIWIQSLRIWKSDKEAREFLFRAHPDLSGHRPVDLTLQNEIGAGLVRNLLGRLEVGSAV
jgi:putative toxin-antitoxin system antitoxin component (TIGR02293 family)